MNTEQVLLAVTTPAVHSGHEKITSSSLFSGSDGEPVTTPPLFCAKGNSNASKANMSLQLQAEASKTCFSVHMGP